MEQVRREVGSWSWWPREHRRHTRCLDEEIMSGLTYFLRIGSAGRDIDVDVLTTELVIDRRQTHKMRL